MQTILIAESSEVLAGALVAALREHYDVRSCAEGNAALWMLEDLRPDVLIIDLSLPVIDGLSVLQASAHKPSVILALSPVVTPYVLQAAEDAAVGYIITGPCTVDAVVNRLKEMIRISQLTDAKADPQALVAAHLDHLKLPQNRKGYRQLKVGVPLFAQDPDQSLFKELYPAIIERCGGETAEQVESTIRAVVHDTWNKHTAIWKEYFPEHDEPPSNWDVFRVLAEKLQEEGRVAKCRNTPQYYAKIYVLRT